MDNQEATGCCGRLTNRLCPGQDMRPDEFLQRYTGQTVTLQKFDIKQFATLEFWKTFVVDPSSNFYFYWSMINMLAVFYNLMVLVVRGVFEQVNYGGQHIWYFFDYTSDFVYILDMVVKSRKGFLDQGLLVKDTKLISMKYMKSWQFVLDVLTVLPTDIFYVISGFKSIFRLNRLGRIRRMAHFFHLAETRTNYPNLLRVGNLVLYILVIIHFNACIFFAISKNIGIGSDGWVYPNPYGEYLEDKEKYDYFWNEYLYSFYWATLTLTTIGDTQFPVTPLETLYCCVCSLAGVLIFATIFGNVGAMINAMDRKRTEFQNKVDTMKEYMETHKIPKDVQSRIIKWFGYNWKNKQTEDDREVLKHLPAKMQSEMGVRVYRETLRDIKMFKYCETGLLEELVLKLRLQVFSPGDYVCRKGDIGREMYIIKSGKLQVVTEDGSVLARLADGQIFGEISVLDIPGNAISNRRTANVMTVGYADLLCLSKKDLWEALEDYPSAKQILIEKGKAILRKSHTLNEEAMQKAEERPSNSSLIDMMVNETHKNTEILEKQNKKQDKLMEKLNMIQRLLSKDMPDFEFEMQESEEEESVPQIEPSDTHLDTSRADMATLPLMPSPSRTVSLVDYKSYEQVTRLQADRRASKFKLEGRDSFSMVVPDTIIEISGSSSDPKQSQLPETSEAVQDSSDNTTWSQDQTQGEASHATAPEILVSEPTSDLVTDTPIAGHIPGLSPITEADKTSDVSAPQITVSNDNSAPLYSTGQLPNTAGTSVDPTAEMQGNAPNVPYTAVENEPGLYTTEQAVQPAYADQTGNVSASYMTTSADSSAPSDSTGQTSSMTMPPASGTTYQQYNVTIPNTYAVDPAAYGQPTEQLPAVTTDTVPASTPYTYTTDPATLSQPAYQLPSVTTDTVPASTLYTYTTDPATYGQSTDQPSVITDTVPASIPYVYATDPATLSQPAYQLPAVTTDTIPASTPYTYTTDPAIYGQSTTDPATLSQPAYQLPAVTTDTIPTLIPYDTTNVITAPGIPGVTVLPEASAGISTDTSGQPGTSGQGVTALPGESASTSSDQDTTQKDSESKPKIKSPYFSGGKPRRKYIHK